uniref:BTB domain-containing protein n=2 Tax=Hordeum vulgare subsp. vulgare TaxID=112509 RepID=A0A8I6XE66_HORVV
MAPVSRRPCFRFAFDSALFSDKTLRLEVVSADPDLPVSRKRPRARDDVTSPDTVKKRQEAYERRDESSLEESDEPVGYTSKGPAGVIVIGNTNPVKPNNIEANDTDDDRLADFSRHARKAYVRLQEEGKIDNAGKGLDNVQKTPVPQVQHIRVSAMLLASESQFFHKLFTNGMKESNQNVIELQVSEAELEPVLEIIKFIYNGEFSKLDPKSLLATLLAADKYEVTTAISECGELLLNSEMTLGTARMYLDFTTTNSVLSEALGPLKSAAGDFVALKFKDVVQHENELLQMPLSVIRCVFLSSELIVPSEYHVYNFLLKWASENYPDPSHSRDVFCNELIHLVRFMHVSLDGLRQFFECPLMADDRKRVMTIIMNALLFKDDNTCSRVCNWNYDPRVYLTKPVKVSILHPYAEAIAYMDLTLDDCYRISKPGNTSRINSEVFTFYGHTFFMRVVCRMDPASSAPMALGLFLGTNHLRQTPVNLNVNFAVRQRPSGDFFNKLRFNRGFTNGNTYGMADLFSCPWAQLVGDGSMYVIDGRIHIRVKVKTGAG